MHVAIVGGGLAGLAAAAELGRRGHIVTILEARNRLGGRAGSFTDPATGELVDACQHVAMGCCTAYRRFLADAGLGDKIAPQSALHFLTPDGRRSRFAADAWPAPFHLGRALLGAHYLTVGEKQRVVYGLGRLMRLPTNDDRPLLPWLTSQRQTDRTIRRFWSIVLVSALNESIDRVGTKYARKVFADGFFADREAWKVWVPTVPLGELYGDKLRTVLASRNVAIRENAAVKAVSFDGSPTVHLRDGSTVTADRIVLAVPFERVLGLLPAPIADDPFFARIAKLEPSPITSVHLWTDRPITNLPHAVVVDGLTQWLFTRRWITGEWYSQVVVSASREWRALGHGELERRAVAELHRVFPDFRHATVLRSKVVTEKSATFSAVPGVDALRPTQRTPVPNLVLAGDWTATGWPATMEGAVISGHRAALEC
jgi:squalene-associated FAD-dependent desaturase